METYENSFFRPKPFDGKCGSCGDSPCSLNTFSCTERWWETNVKKYIEMISTTFGKAVTLDTDELEASRTIDVRIDGNFVSVARSKDDVAKTLKTIYSMLSLYVPTIVEDGSDDTQEDGA